MGGLLFWAGECEQLDQRYENDPYKLVKAFVDSGESEERGLLEVKDEALVNNIYQNLFGREVDEEGLSFYTDKLATVELDQYTVIYSIINGARGDDVGITLQQAADSDTVNIGYLVRSDTSAIAFGHDFLYGFGGTGTIEFDPVEDGVLTDNTFDFRKLEALGGLRLSLPSRSIPWLT